MPSKYEIIIAILDDVLLGIIVIAIILWGLVSLGYISSIWALVIGTALAFVLALFSFQIMKPQMERPKNGSEAMVGKRAIAMSNIDPEGTVLVDGEYWTAFSGVPIQQGTFVEVVSVKGLKLQVKRQKTPTATDGVAFSQHAMKKDTLQTE